MWTELDRQTELPAFYTDSFVVTNSVEVRFIRMTHTGKNQRGDDVMAMRGVEFFGTLSE
jgi:hypothetical protein